jgi:hypothetical protein
MPYQVLKKGTILIPSGTASDPDKRHLFVVCTDACKDGKHLLVPIATWTNEFCDATCCLLIGEHRFIRHKSYVLYRKARVMVGTDLVKGVEEKMFSPDVPMNGQTFLRIANGVCLSPQTPRRIKNYAGCT